MDFFHRFDTAMSGYGSLSVLKDFSLTVKAATLIYISGRGLAILSAKEGKTGLAPRTFGT